MSDHAIDSLEACAEWVESLASPTLANDPFIRAADWAAKLIREYASALTLPSREEGCGMADDEPCVCDTAFVCLADEHDKGRCDTCETPGIYPLCCGEHRALMCPSCDARNHPLAEEAS